MDWIAQPWPWWVSGILLGLIVPLLAFFAGKSFGISASLQQIGAMLPRADKLDYLRNHDRRDGMWVLVFVIGLVIGGTLAARFLTTEPIQFLPAGAYSLRGALQLLFGGVLVGFGARYANGCTSGHSITGIANLNGPSLLATICFFVGGTAVTWTLGRVLFPEAMP